MNSIMASLLVAACIFAGGLTGLYLNRILPERYLTRETQDVIKLGIGMLSVLASLVLGLLIATAKTSYDSTDRAIRSYAAELALLNEVLRDYGGAGSFGSLTENHVDGGLAIFGEVFESFDRLETEAAKERQRGVANCGEHLRGMAGVGSRLIFTATDVANVMQLIFDAPVIAR